MSKVNYRVSYYVLYALFALIILIFALFFGVGYDNPVGDYNDPKFTDLLLYFQYAMVLVCVCLLIWSVVKGIASSTGSGSGNEGGVPGGKVTMATGVIFIVAVVVSYLLGMGSTEFTAADGTVTTAGWVHVADTFIWTIYILGAVAFIGLLVNLSGLLKK